MVKENLAGKRFGKLTVVSPAPNKGNKTCWNCLCECGNYTIVSSTHLKDAHTVSCGCYHKQRAKETNLKVNKYEINGEKTYIIDNKGNKAIIDTINLQDVLQYCWSMNLDGYFVTGANGGTSLHQYIIKLNNKKYTPFKNHIDHINRNKLDNRSKNLRVVSPSVNQLNRDKKSKNPTGLVGVSIYGNKYRSKIRINGKSYSKAGFNTPEEAYEWRKTLKEMMIY